MTQPNTVSFPSTGGTTIISVPTDKAKAEPIVGPQLTAKQLTGLSAVMQKLAAGMKRLGRPG